MAPPDSRKEVGGLCYAKAEAATHDAKRIFGAGVGDKWIQGTVTEVINHQPTRSKRATTYILADYNVGNKVYNKSIPLQLLKAQLPEGPATFPTAEEARVRLAILKQSRSNQQLLINSNNEIYGACRHRPCFHRYVKQTTPSTDESINDERASPTHEVTTDFTRCTVCLADV